MATWIITSALQQCDSNGVPYSGAEVYVYDVATTTLKNIYTDTGLTVSGANPIICDSAGRHDIRYCATGSYKIVVKTSAGVTVFTRDNIDGGIPVGTGALAITNGGTGATTAAAAIAALGGATTSEVAALSTTVAGLVGATASTEATHLATGTTGQRSGAPTDGDIRRNITIPQFEGYDGAGTTWRKFLLDNDIASPAEAVAQSSSVKLITPLSAKQGNPFCSRYAYFRDEKTSGTDGGTATSGSFATRTINTTVVNNITGASLSANQIILPTGTFYVEASAPARDVNANVAKWRNTTDASDTMIGTVERASVGGGSTRSLVFVWFTIAAQKTFELQHRVTTTAATVGFGTAATFGVVEVYSEIKIWQLA